LNQRPNYLIILESR